MGRLCDTLIEWLMRPRVRRVRRWSFVATVPLSLLVAHIYGVHEGIAVVAARLALSASVAIAAWRLGGDRGDALRDLLMHPRLRAFGRAELDILTALPRLLLTGVAHTNRAGLAYAGGTFGLALALAFTPVVVSEALVLHLLLRGGWVAWVSTALHAYMLLWLWGFALGAHAYPHRVGGRTAVLRAGPMYRVLVPRCAIASVTEHRKRVPGERGLVQRDGEVLLPVRGRVEVRLELSEPVRVQRPLHEPLHTQRLAIASDDPEGLIEQLLSPMRRANDNDPRMGLLGHQRLVRTTTPAGNRSAASSSRVIASTHWCTNSRRCRPSRDRMSGQSAGGRAACQYLLRPTGRYAQGRVGAESAGCSSPTTLARSTAHYIENGFLF